MLKCNGYHRLLLFVLLALGLSLAFVVVSAEMPADEKIFHVHDDVYRFEDYLFRVLEDETVEIVEYIGMDGVEDIPSVIAGHLVTEIGDKAFTNEGEIQFYTDEYPDYLREYIRRIRLPEGIRRIGDYAFEECFNLMEISFPSTLEEIGEGAFDKCEALSRAVLPPNLRTLGAYAFRGCVCLTAMELPDSLTNIGANPFAECVNLKRFEVSSSHPVLCYEKGMLYDKNQLRLISCTRESWGDTAEIPENIRVIGESSFSFTPFVEILIPESVETIERYAFADCVNMTSLTIPNTVQTIGDNPIIRCGLLTELIVSEDNPRFSIRNDSLIDEQESRLIASLFLRLGLIIEERYSYSFENDAPTEIEAYGRKVFLVKHRDISYDDYVYEDDITRIPETCVVPEGIKVIGSGAFYGVVVKKIVLPESICEIRSEAFSNCQYLEVCRLPGQISEIPDRMFENCKALWDTNIPDGVVSIGERAFAYTSLEEIVLPSSVSELGPYAFSYCSENSGNTITLSDGITCIPKGAFCGSGIRSINFPEGITRIEDEAFSRTHYLESAVLPENITSIPEYCFFDSNIRSVTLPNHLEYIGDQAFRVDDYNMGQIKGTLSFPDSVRYVGRYAFRNQGELEKVIIPGNIEWLGEGTFYQCNSLKSAELGEGLSVMPDYMFYWDELRELIIPNSVTFVGIGAIGRLRVSEDGINDCYIQIGDNRIYLNQLESIDIETPDFQIHDGFIINKSDHRLIDYISRDNEGCCTVPNGVEIIGKGTLNGCAFSELVLPETLRVIENNGISSCHNLEAINLPDSLESIGDEAFEGTPLKEIKLPPNIKSIGAYAFYTWRKPVDEVIIPESVQEIGLNAFDCKRIVFSSKPINLNASPVVVDSITEIVVPEDNPVLELVDGNLYDKVEHKLICQLTDAPIKEGTLIIGEGTVYSQFALKKMIIPESVQLIYTYKKDMWYGGYPYAYVVPGSFAETFISELGW